MVIDSKIKNPPFFVRHPMNNLKILLREILNRINSLLMYCSPLHDKKNEIQGFLFKGNTLFTNLELYVGII